MKSAAALMLPAMRSRDASPTPGGNQQDAIGVDAGSVPSLARGRSTREKFVSGSALGDEGSVSSSRNVRSSVEEKSEGDEGLGDSGNGADANFHDRTEVLPRVVEKYLLKELATHAQQILEGHPLAASLSNTMLANLSKEVSKEVLSIAAAAFFAYVHHKLNLNELPEGLINGSISSIETTDAELSEENLHTQTQVKETVLHVLQVSSGKPHCFSAFVNLMNLFFSLLKLT